VDAACSSCRGLCMLICEGLVDTLQRAMLMGLEQAMPRSTSGRLYSLNPARYRERTAAARASSTQLCTNKVAQCVHKPASNMPRKQQDSQQEQQPATRITPPVPPCCSVALTWCRAYCQSSFAQPVTSPTRGPSSVFANVIRTHSLQQPCSSQSRLVD
jgi:hypothetical protein